MNEPMEFNQIMLKWTATMATQFELGKSVGEAKMISQRLNSVTQDRANDSFSEADIVEIKTLVRELGYKLNSL